MVTFYISDFLLSFVYFYQASKVRIYKRKQENKNSTKKASKKTGKKERKQELDQEKKKKLSFFLVHFLGRVLVFLFSFINSHLSWKGPRRSEGGCEDVREEGCYRDSPSARNKTILFVCRCLQYHINNNNSTNTQPCSLPHLSRSKPCP